MMKKSRQRKYKKKLIRKAKKKLRSGITMQIREYHNKFRQGKYVVLKKGNKYSMFKLYENVPMSEYVRMFKYRLSKRQKSSLRQIQKISSFFNQPLQKHSKMMAKWKKQYNKRWRFMKKEFLNWQKVKNIAKAELNPNYVIANGLKSLKPLWEKLTTNKETQKILMRSASKLGNHLVYKIEISGIEEDTGTKQKCKLGEVEVFKDMEKLRKVLSEIMKENYIDSTKLRQLAQKYNISNAKHNASGRIENIKVVVEWRK